MDLPRCPDCGAALKGRAASCPGCGLLLSGSAAEAYLALSAELAELEERRKALAKRRAEALTGMRAATTEALTRTRADSAEALAQKRADSAGVLAQKRADSTGVVSLEAAPEPGSAAPPAASEPAAKEQAGPRRDLSHRAVQNLLLLLGGVLLSIAAVVFTLVSWQVPALRALILTVFTLAVLAAPWLLVRRRLVATAETVALIGLVLIPLDTVAVLRISGDDGGPSAGPWLDPLWGVAVGAAALTAVWALYAWRAPLRLPAPVAIVLAQTPLPLAGLAMEADLPAGGAWPAGALVATAALDLLLWRAARRARAAAEYVTSAAAGSITWLAGVGLAGMGLTSTALPGTGPAGTGLTDSGLAGSGPAAVAWGGAFGLPALAGVLGVASLVALSWAGATRGAVARGVIGACAALAAAGALFGVPVHVVPGSWVAAVVAGAACLVLAAAIGLPARLRDGVRTGGLLVLGTAAASKAAAVATVAFAPLGWVISAWPDPPDLGLLSPSGIRWDDSVATPVVMAAAALGSALVPSRGDLWTPGLRQAVCLVAGSLAVLTAPVAAGLPYPASPAVLVALCGALLWAADRRSGAALWLGGYAGVLAACWALADRQATGAVAAGLLLVTAVGAVAGRRTAVRAVGGAGATLAAGLLVWALCGGGMAAALALLGVRAATLVVTRPSRRLAAAVLHARRTYATLALGTLDRLTHLVRRGGRTAAEAAAVVVGLFALGQHLDEEQRALVLAAAALLAAASAWRRPRGTWRTVAAVEACLLAALAPLPLSRAVVPALVGPYGWLTNAWAGAAEGAREALSPAGPWPAQPALLPVLVLAGSAATFAVWARWGRQGATGVAMIVFPLAATTLPVVADLPYWAALAFLIVLTAALALWSAVTRSAAGGASLWTATLAVSWSLADQTATLAVLAAIAVTAALCAVRGKGSPVTSVAASVTGLAVGAESVAAALGGGLGESDAALVLLLVAVLLSRAAALPVLPGAVALPLGGAALALWPVAMVLAQDLARLSLVLAVGAPALASAAGRLRRPARDRAYALAGLASALALLPHLGLWRRVLEHPYDALERPWARLFDGWESPGWVWFVAEPAGFGPSRVVTALGVGAFAVVTWVLLARGVRGAAAGRAVATVAVPGCLVLVPVVADLPYAGTLAFYGVVLVALTVQAVAGSRPGVAGVMAVACALHLAVWSLDDPAYTQAVLGAIAALGAAAGAGARTEPARTGAAVVATVAAGGLAAASGLAAGLRVEVAAFPVLAIAALAALAAALLTRLPALPRPAALPPPAGSRFPVRRPEASRDQDTPSGLREPGAALDRGARRVVRAGVGVEVAGWGLAGVSVVMVAADPAFLCVALACCGVLALAVALRRDRRRAGWPGLALLQLALWLRLALSGVTAPEAYTVPLSVAGLIAAWLVRRRDPGVSSWIGYGTALALTFLPSLYATWHDPGLARPLLLGVAAFAATLAGARARLQAPLILGGIVLVVTAAQEFAPALAAFVGQGPRWLPIAVAGAFLLFTGATYEHRLRDLRKIRRLIVRMR